MALNLDAIEQGFRTAVQVLLGMQPDSVRRANQFNPPPAGDQAEQYATVLVQQLGNVGWDEVTHSNVPEPTGGWGEDPDGSGGFGTGGVNDVVETITGQRHFVASVQFFRGNALVQANRLTQILQSSTCMQQMLAAGIGIGKIGAVRNLSLLVDTYFENRGQLDIEFYVVSVEQLTLATYGKFLFDITDDSPKKQTGSGSGGAGQTGFGT